MGRIVKLMPRFIGDLEYCQNKNWNSPKPQVRERANLMFSRIRNELGEIENGLEIDHIVSDQYKYTFSDGFATIYITAKKDSNNTEYLFVDEIEWHYKRINWWNIIETKTTIEQIITEQINRFIRNECK